MRATAKRYAARLELFEAGISEGEKGGCVMFGYIAANPEALSKAEKERYREYY